LFVFDLQYGLAKNLVSYQKSKSEKPAADNALTQTELELFESVRKKALQNTKFDEPSIFSLPFDPEGAFQVDPTARYVLLKEEQEPEAKPTEVPHFIASDAHVFNEKSRSKVQNEEPSQTLYLHDIQSDTLVLLDFSQLSQINNDKRELIFHPAIFAKTKALALLDIRSADNKDRWIVCINLGKHEILELEHQHDSAWIGGPGISSWNFETGTLGWLRDAQTIYFQSEESGYSHLYTFDLQTKTKLALTSGNFESWGAQFLQVGSQKTGNQTTPVRTWRIRSTTFTRRKAIGLPFQYEHPALGVIYVFAQKSERSSSTHEVNYRSISNLSLAKARNFKL
jgi:hypothetical protein